MPTSVEEFVAWHDAQLALLAKERTCEIEETSLLFSNCSASLLEKNGLALLSLGVSNISVGLGGKSLVELERPGAHHASPVFPPHLFRPGDIASIAEHSSTAAKGKKKEETASKDIEGVVYKISDTKIVIAIRQNESSSEELDLPERCKVLKLANDATFERMDKNLRFLRKSVLGPPDSETSTPSPPNPLVSVLLGFSQPTFHQPDSSKSITFLDDNLDESQRKAVHFVLNETEEVGLIHGPPGTGKTQTLVEVIRQLVSSGKRVLVCGASNLAVDNLVERLSLHQVPLTRLGHPARILANLHSATLDYQTAHSNSGEIVKDIKREIDQIMNEIGKGKMRGKERREKWGEIKELRREFRKREVKVVEGVVGQAKVILSTCHGAGGRQIFNTEFDVAIIDEAAQALEAVCWIPIMKAKKLILAGDHLQLSPTVKSGDKHAKTNEKKKAAKTKGKKENGKPAVDEDDGNSSKENDKPTTVDRSLKPASSLSYTLFDRLLHQHGDKIKRLLTVQYRMNEQIMRFPSGALYDDKLTAADSVKDRLLTDLPVVNQDEDVCKEPVIFIDTAGNSMYERSDSEGVSTDSKSNENEAALVVRHVEILTKAGVPASSISLISPYQAQVNLLASILRPRFPSMEIGSVDGFQGRENDVVIVSLCRSNEEREVGFLRDNRRLNVAMTRPRRQLVIVGDSSTVSEGSKFLKDWMNWLEENADVSMAGLIDM